MTAPKLKVAPLPIRSEEPRFYLFGSIRTSVGPCPQRLMVRQMFALLALNIGRVVSVDQLCCELWHDPPATWRAQLSIFAGMLRETQAIPITTIRESRRTMGLRLEGCDDDVDALRFLKLLRRAKAEALQHTSQAEKLLGEVLSLCEQPLLEELEVGEILERWVIRLREAVQSAHLLKTELAFRSGNSSDEIVDELRTLWLDDPLREDIALSLMRTLCQILRRDEALRVYQATRRALVEELGIEPAPPIQELHQAILNGDPSLF